MAKITKVGAIILGEKYFAFRGFEFDDSPKDNPYHNMAVLDWALTRIEDLIAEQVQALAIYEDSKGNL